MCRLLRYVFLHSVVAPLWVWIFLIKVWVVVLLTAWCPSCYSTLQELWEVPMTPDLTFTGHSIETPGLAKWLKSQLPTVQVLTSVHKYKPNALIHPRLVLSLIYCYRNAFKCVYKWCSVPNGANAIHLCFTDLGTRNLSKHDTWLLHLSTAHAKALTFPFLISVPVLYLH